MGNLIGSIEPGKRADLALYDVDTFGMQPIHDVYSTIVYSLKASDARSVLVDGRFVVDEGRMAGIDEGEAMAKLKATAARVRAAAADRRKPRRPPVNYRLKLSAEGFDRAQRTAFDHADLVRSNNS
jgi:urease alpha subunit